MIIDLIDIYSQLITASTTLFLNLKDVNGLFISTTREVILFQFIALQQEKSGKKSLALRVNQVYDCRGYIASLAPIPGVRVSVKYRSLINERSNHSRFDL